MMTLNYQNTQLVMDTKKGCIASLLYHGKEYVGGQVPVFELAFRDEKGVQSRINTYDMSLASAKTERDTLTCVYTKDAHSVTMTVTMGEELVWNIQVDSVQEKVLEWVNYPQITVPDDLSDKGGDSKILYGYNEGTLVEDMTACEQGVPHREPTYPCFGNMPVYPAMVELQFLAYYNQESGLYFASHDTEDYLKGIGFYREAGGIKLEFRHFCGGDFNESYRMAYPMVMAFFHGDWYDGAEIYRKWFQSVPHDGFIPIEENKKLPEWYGESPVIVTYPVRGRHDTDVMNPNKLFPYINVLPHVERLEKAFGSKLMILLMHWEGTAPWAPPIVWPPYGGEDKLKELIDALHERGDVLGVYCSGLGWTIDSRLDNYNTQELFDRMNLKDSMCLSPTQELPYSNICQGQRMGYDMCPVCEFTRTTIKEQVSHMVNAGIDYAQLMDQNHGGTSYFCYSKEHGHPPVPGKWQVDAVKSLLTEAQENAGKTLFGCESAAAESYINQLLFSDNRFNIAYRMGRPVPAYSYVFHEYLNNFMGNQVCTDYWVDYDKTPLSWYERMAYAFSAGDMLTVIITENGEIDWHWGKKNKGRIPPNQEETAEFVCALNAWRTGKGKKYLHSGKMIKHMKVECGTYPVYRMVERDGTPNGVANVPEIHTSAWQATDGGKAQFLINYHPEEKTCVVEISEDGYVLTDGVTERTLPVGRQTITIKPLSAVMFEKK